MKRLDRLTDLQLTLLDVLWRAGEATARQVHRAMGPSTGLAAKSVGTMLRRLDEQGILEHREEGRRYVYRARISRQQVRRARLRSMADSLFAGSMAGLVSHALEETEVREGDAERIRRLLERADAGEAPE